MCRKIICLTPIRNEAWIIERFLKCASIWADHIIVADQNSEDDSREIAQDFRKVILINNPVQKSFNEYEMRKLLFEEARKIEGEKILIALDADEMLTPNFYIDPEWKTIMNAKSGTVFCFQIANLTSDITKYWIPNFDMPRGFIDNGSEYRAGAIHTLHVPFPANSTRVSLKSIKIMHYQFTDWNRMESKHRWYQCWERLYDHERSATSIYRQYNHMYAINPGILNAVPEWWFQDYAKHGIDMTSVTIDYNYRWDKEVLAYIEKYGSSFFAKQSIWDVDWKSKASFYGYTNTDQFSDPRNKFQRMIHKYLRNTQPNCQKIFIRIMDKIFKNIFKF